MAAIRWLKETLQSNVIWKNCPVHQAIVIMCDYSSKTCGNCGASNATEACLEMGTSKQGRACYRMECPPSHVGDHLDVSMPLRFCSDCYQHHVTPVMHQDMITAGEASDSIFMLPLVLHEIVMDYLYQAIVRCPFH